MGKYKPGLHKDVSTIFDGVRIPQEAPVRQVLGEHTRNFTTDVIRKLVAAAEQATTDKTDALEELI